MLLFECYADRSEWKAGLAAVSDAFKFISLEFQVCLVIANEEILTICYVVCVMWCMLINVIPSPSLCLFGLAP